MCWIEQKPLYDSFTFVQSAWNANQAKKLAHSLNRIPALLCPSGTQEYTTATAEYYNNTAPYTAHYCGIMGPYGANPVTNQAYSCDANVESQGPTGREGLMPLVPDASKGNRGPAGFATIRDGKFDTRIDGRGTVGGPHRVEISPPPLDVGELSASQTAPLAKPLFREYVTDVDLPRQDTTHDFAVPATP